jgi:hypothetical protein
MFFIPSQDLPSRRLIHVVLGALLRQQLNGLLFNKQQKFSTTVKESWNPTKIKLHAIEFQDGTTSYKMDRRIQIEFLPDSDNGIHSAISGSGVINPECKIISEPSIILTGIIHQHCHQDVP